MARIGTLVVALAAAASLGATNGSAVRAQNPTLFGTVGREFTISLKDAQGNNVTKIDPGTYDVEIRDLAEFHSFHLEGPGVNERTEVEFTGTVTWTVTFGNGNYVYHCDPHPNLRGTFVAGTLPKPPPRVITSRTKLIVTAGPAQVITLKTAAGKVVKALKRGTYTVLVRDRSRIHNVHLVAPGYNRKTTINFLGVQTWRVRLAREGTLRYRCDPHASFGMRGSARIFA